MDSRLIFIFHFATCSLFFYNTVIPQCEWVEGLRTSLFQARADSTTSHLALLLQHTAAVQYAVSLACGVTVFLLYSPLQKEVDRLSTLP
jgi:hypothetical protein